MVNLRDILSDIIRPAGDIADEVREQTGIRLGNGSQQTGEDREVSNDRTAIDRNNTRRLEEQLKQQELSEGGSSRSRNRRETNIERDENGRVTRVETEFGDYAPESSSRRRVRSPESRSRDEDVQRLDRKLSAEELMRGLSESGMNAQEIGTFVSNIERATGQEFEVIYNNRTGRYQLADGETEKLARAVEEYAKEVGMDIRYLEAGNRAAYQDLFKILQRDVGAPETRTESRSTDRNRNETPTTEVPTQQAPAQTTTPSANASSQNRQNNAANDGQAATEEKPAQETQESPKLELKPAPELAARINELLTQLPVNEQQATEVMAQTAAALNAVGVEVDPKNREDVINKFAAYTQTQHPEIAEKIMSEETIASAQALQQAGNQLAQDATKAASQNRAASQDRTASQNPASEKPQEETPDVSVGKMQDTENQRLREEYHARRKQPLGDGAQFGIESRIIMDIHTAYKVGNDEYLHYYTDTEEGMKKLKDMGFNTIDEVLATHPYTREQLTEEQQPKRGQGTHNGHQIYATGGTFVRGEDGNITVYRDGNKLTEEQARAQDIANEQNAGMRRSDSQTPRQNNSEQPEKPETSSVEPITPDELALAFDKAGKESIGRVDSFKKHLNSLNGTDMPVNNELTPEFLQAMSGAINTHVDPNTIQELRDGGFANLENTLNGLESRMKETSRSLSNSETYETALNNQGTADRMVAQLSQEEHVELRQNLRELAKKKDFGYDESASLEANLSAYLGSETMNIQQNFAAPNAEITTYLRAVDNHANPHVSDDLRLNHLAEKAVEQVQVNVRNQLQIAEAAEKVQQPVLNTASTQLSNTNIQIEAMSQEDIQAMLETSQVFTAEDVEFSISSNPTPTLPSGNQRGTNEQQTVNR